MAIARIALECDPGERAQALDRLERFVRDEVTPAGQAEALFRLAEAELQAPATRGRGLASLLAAVERRPDMERALALVQGAGVTDEELAGVLPLYERAARQTGNDRQLLDALTRRAQTAAATPESIREGYDLATALHDDARADALLVALVDFSSGEAGKAEAVWGLIELGKRCRARGDFEGAHGHFARALELTDPERVEPHLRQLASDVREREGDSPLAARIYETLRARVPGNAGLWNDLFDLYARIDDLASCDRLARERLDQLMEAGGAHRDPHARGAPAPGQGRGRPGRRSRRCATRCSTIPATWKPASCWRATTRPSATSRRWSTCARASSRRWRTSTTTCTSRWSRARSGAR